MNAYLTHPATHGCLMELSGSYHPAYTVRHGDGNVLHADTIDPAIYRLGSRDGNVSKF